MLKFKTSERNVHFISDCHFSHDRKWLVEPRGYSTIEEHDEGLIEKWNKQVEPHDVVWSLGDFIFLKGAEERMEKIIRRLNFSTLYMLNGNHVAGIKQLKEKHGRQYWMEDQQRMVEFRGDYQEIIVDGRGIVLSHYPILSWNGQAGGSVCIFGHVHSNLNNTPIGELYFKSRAIDVGVENFGRPVSFKEIIDIVDKRGIVTFDHHDSKTQNPF
jgi:calcineurin-like phosphoesterase family protein